MAGGMKKYPDLRYLYIRGLLSLERFQRTRHFLKSAAECTSRAIVSLELAENPVKSVHQAEKLEGIGAEIKKKLQTIYEEQRYSSDPPVKGKYCSSASAILVALLDATEKEIIQGHSQDHSVLIEEGSLKSRARQLSEEKFVDSESNNDGTVPMTTAALPSVTHPVSNEQTTPVEAAAPWIIPARKRRNPEDVLYTNDEGGDGVILVVDTQEMGGDRQGLGELCQLLEQTGLQYQSRHLQCGDYRWIWRCDGVDRWLPCLIERKRADDMAKSLKDGRFWKQVTKMVEWKKSFKELDVNCQLHYIVEGEPEQYVVKCADGCHGVGKCGYPNVTQVKCALRDLKCHPELQVQTTDNIEMTVLILSSITDELQQRAKKGDFDEMIVKELSGAINSARAEAPEVLLNEDSNDEHSIVGAIKTAECKNKQDRSVKVSSAVKTAEKRGRTARNSNKAKASKREHSSDSDECLYSEEPDSHDFKNKSYDREEDSEEFLPLEPLAQYHCAGGSNVRFPGQQIKLTNNTPKIKRHDGNSDSFGIRKLTPKKVAGSYKSCAREENFSVLNIDGVKDSAFKGDISSVSSDVDSNICRQERAAFSSKKLKLNLNPNESYTESVKNYTPPSRRSKGKVYLMKKVKRKSELSTDLKDKCDSNKSSSGNEELKQDWSVIRVVTENVVGAETVSKYRSDEIEDTTRNKGFPDNVDASCVSHLQGKDKSGQGFIHHSSDSDEDSLPDLSHLCKKSSKSNMDSLFGLHSNNYENSVPEERGRCYKKDKKLLNLPESSSAENLTVTSSADDVKKNKELFDVHIPYTRADKEQTEKISLIQSILPNVSKMKALASLKKHGGNIDLCMAALLDSNSPE